MMVVRNALRALWHWVVKGRWSVVRCGWPYGSGYGTYCRRRRILLDTGLSREEARRLARELNQNFQ